MKIKIDLYESDDSRPTLTIKKDIKEFNKKFLDISKYKYIFFDVLEEGKEDE